MATNDPGRNDPCPCGSGRKYKQCCLAARTLEDSTRLRLRRVEGMVVNKLLDFIDDNLGEIFIDRAWADFWSSDDAPEDLSIVPEWESMFVPWLVLGFVPDPNDEDLDPEWPTQQVGLEWLATTEAPVPDLERAFIEAASRSPFSALAVEGVQEGRSVDLKDVLTGRRLHVLLPMASRGLQEGDLLFTRVVTLEGVSLLFGTAPYIVPPEWHTRIIDWREGLFDARLMTLDDLADFDIEIRELYFDIAVQILDPAPPRLANTDGDPLEEPEELPEPAQSSEELQAFQDEMLRRHFIEWVDTPVPALGNKTPRDAVLTAGGRERLEALLVEFARRADNGAPTMPARVAELRSTLGLPKRD